jgi:ribA/ribD-fused uncharacterized protein
VTTIAFTKVRLPYGWLSNMSPHAVTWYGEVWPTSEHLFQALRFSDSSEVRREIHATPNPLRAKLLAKRRIADAAGKTLRHQPRSGEDLATMETVLLAKARQHSWMQRDLLATGDATIVEDVTNRPSVSGLFWGARRVADAWVGHNHLGRIWMGVREYLDRGGGL